MANTENDPEILAHVKFLQRRVEVLDELIDEHESLMREHPPQSEEAAKTLWAITETLKRDREDSINSLNLYMAQFRQPELEVETKTDYVEDWLSKSTYEPGESSGTNSTILTRFGLGKHGVCEFKKGEDSANKGLKQLETETDYVGDWSSKLMYEQRESSTDNSRILTRFGVGKHDVHVFKKREDSVDKGLKVLMTGIYQSEERRHVDQSILIHGTEGREEAPTSGTDLSSVFLHGSGVEGKELHMPGLTSNGEDTEEEPEELMKADSDVRNRFLGKISQQSSTDDLEHAGAVEDEDISTNIEGLEQEICNMLGGKDRTGELETEVGDVDQSVLVQEREGRGSRFSSIVSHGSGVEGQEQDMQGLISDGEDTEEEPEESMKADSDVRNRFLGKIRRDSSNDDLEHEGSVGSDISSNIEGLEQEMHDMLSGRDSSELKNVTGDVKLMSEAQCSRNFMTKEVAPDTSEKGHVDLGVFIGGLEEKVLLLMRQSKEEFKKDQSGANKSFMEWLKSCDESDDDYEAVKVIKAQAVNIATEISRLLFNLVFLVTDTEVASKFQVLSSSLKLRIEGEDSVVICRIIALLEMADKAVRKGKGLKLESLGLGGESEAKETEPEGSKIKKGLFDESQVDQLILQFSEVILHLEHILMHPGLPDLKLLLKAALPSMVAGLKQCEEEFKGIDSRVSELKGLSATISGPENLKMNEMCNSAMILKIDELWNQLGESEKEKGQMRD